MQSLRPAATVKKPQNDSVALKDASSVYRACSMAFAKSVGCASPDDVVGRSDFELLPEQVAKQQRALDVQTLQTAKADISTIRLVSQTNRAKTATAMIVRTPVLDNENRVCGIDVRLVGGPAINSAASAPQVDYANLMKEGLLGSIIINDHQVLFATDAAAHTLGYDSVEQLQFGMSVCTSVGAQHLKHDNARLRHSRLCACWLA